MKKLLGILVLGLLWCNINVADESELNILYSDEYKTEILINKSLREYLQKIKTEIDNHTSKWDIYKKITNKYEFINTNIHLDKYIPIQAGLGGGSGNAATAMYAFNHLLNYPASNNDMVEWSGEIGSDISFFFSTGTGKYSIV